MEFGPLDDVDLLEEDSVFTKQESVANIGFKVPEASLCDRTLESAMMTNRKNNFWDDSLDAFEPSHCKVMRRCEESQSKLDCS